MIRERQALGSVVRFVSVGPNHPEDGRAQQASVGHAEPGSTVCIRTLPPMCVSWRPGNLKLPQETLLDAVGRAGGFIISNGVMRITGGGVLARLTRR
jgi:hypothetical protein